MLVQKLSGLLLAGILLVTPAFADFPPANTISTQGHGEIKASPDALSLSLMVEATHKNLADAREENSRKMQAIIASLKALEIPNLTLETQNVQVFPMYEHEKDRLPKVIGYRVTNGLNVKVEKAGPDLLGRYGSRIADTALKSGANHLHGMNFYLSDPAPYRIKALQAAVTDARRNANAMAEAAGITISGVHSIEGTPQYHYAYPAQRMMMKETMASGGVSNTNLPVETGETTITSDVTIRFTF